MARNIAQDELPLINAALGLVGSEPIQTLDEDTELAETVALHWPRARDHCMHVHAWGFCRRTLLLAREPGAPQNGWQYAFNPPGGAGELEAVLIGNTGVPGTPTQPYAPLRDFGREEGKVFANQAVLYGRFRFRAAVILWPELFINAMETLGGAYFAVPTGHDRELADDMRQEAIGTDQEAGKGGILGRAIAEDLAQRPMSSPILAYDPLTMARYM